MSPRIAVRQTIYVTHINSFMKTEPNLTPYKITEFNRSSFYAKKENEDKPLRFDMRTMKAKGIMAGEQFIAYLDEQEYWDVVRLRQEKIDLSRKAHQVVAGMSLAQLRDFQSWASGK